MRIDKIVHTDWPPAAAFAYLADFTTTNTWDPGTVNTERVSGDGQVGTTYRNISRFRGKDSELTYTVVEHESPHRIRLVGENSTITADDLITVAPDGTGASVRYVATFRLKGLAKLAAPFLKGAFAELGDSAEAGLRAALSGPVPQHS